MGKTTYTRDCEPDCLTRNCTKCGKFMALVFEDGGSDWSRQEWACKCGQVDIVEWSPGWGGRGGLRSIGPSRSTASEWSWAQPAT